MPAKQNAQSVTVDDYLSGLPEESRRTLEPIREAIRAAAPSAEETVSYGIPLYKLRGKHLIGFGASTRHLSLYVTDSAVLDRFRQQLAEFDRAGTKTTVRFTTDKPLPLSLVTKIVESRIDELDA